MIHTECIGAAQNRPARGACVIYFLPMTRIGLDVGGTKTELVALSPAGKELLRRREPTPHGGYAAALSTLVRMVLDAEAQLGVRCSVGVGTPGTLVPSSGRLTNAYATPYNEQPLKPDLEVALQREVRIANDANCFALSEAHDGAARGAGVAFGVIIGTGTGGGIVVDGRALAGANGIAGEWGHNPLPWSRTEEHPGPPCYCGRNGCIERFLSGPALSDDYQRASGIRLEAEDIIAAAAQGDAGCEQALQRYESRMARALASVINFLDPDVIVLGGGLSNMDRLYESVPRLWRAFIYGRGTSTRLVKALHGDSSGVLGAARLWPACPSEDRSEGE
jgi:predicted NBD/HSP70 family sugar kinase